MPSWLQYRYEPHSCAEDRSSGSIIITTVIRSLQLSIIKLQTAAGSRFRGSNAQFTTQNKELCDNFWANMYVGTITTAEIPAAILFMLPFLVTVVGHKWPNNTSWPFETSQPFSNYTINTDHWVSLFLLVCNDTNTDIAWIRFLTFVMANGVV